MTTITGITSPKYSIFDQSMIDVAMVTVEHGVIPCSLFAGDAAKYVMAGDEVTNAQLFTAAKNGVFGPVTPFQSKTVLAPKT